MLILNLDVEQLAECTLPDGRVIRVGITRKGRGGCRPRLMIDAPRDVLIHRGPKAEKGKKDGEAA